MSDKPFVAEFSADESRVNLRGSWYRAEAAKEPGRCSGCSMKDGFRCTLTAALYLFRTDFPLGVAKCQPLYRRDSRHIVWVLDV